MSKRKTWAVTVDGRVWETCPSRGAGLRLWKSMADNELFKRCRVALYGPRGGLIREKSPESDE